MNPSLYTLFWGHRRNRAWGASPCRFASTGQPGDGFHQLHDQRALSIAKSTACERFLYGGGWGKLGWKATAITGTPTASLDLSAPAIPLGYPGRAPVTGTQLMDVLTDTNICSADRTERVVDFGRPAPDGRVVLP
jgi:hypothetical protein